MAKRKEKGLAWVDKSLTTKEYPKWSYGLSSLYALPDELDSLMGSIYFQALPYLGFNQHITKEFRTLPSEYQGIYGGGL